VSGAFLASLIAFGVGSLVTACGGGAGGPGAGQGLVLLSFNVEALDNVALNTQLVFEFSEPVDPSTITAASLQLREGGAFGLSLPGVYMVDGAKVTFEPRLPGLCDLSDAAFKADTQYRVQLVGHPEEFSIRNMAGQPLALTTTREFHTRIDTDPQIFTDQVPATSPRVLSSAPSDGDEAVAVVDGNRVVLTMSENIAPCTVNDATVLFHMYQFGDPAVMQASNGGGGAPSGFATDAGQDTSDQTPGDPFSWTTSALQAGVTTLSAPQKILADIQLQQSFGATQIIVTPKFGFNANPLLNKSRFPENALIVLQLTFGMQDFGNQPLTPFTMAFTTSNLPLQNLTYDVETQGETPWDSALTTARIIETAPGLVQGFLLFAGDGDNGGSILQPTLPQSDPGTCVNDFQTNDAVPDDFDPGTDVLLDTGATPNTCPNATDGSFAVVWEFNTFRIRSGLTVRIVGVNPAIILVQGDVLIEANASLLARGDGQAGAPQGKGEGNKNATTSSKTKGGIGVAGGGDGGGSPGASGTSTPARKGEHGVQGYYHTTPTGPLATDVGDPGATGGGHGNISCKWNTQSNPNNRNTPSGGGGGHAVGGSAGTALGSGSAPTSVDGATDGAAGGVYGDSGGRLLTPEAGSGGGAGGALRPFTSTVGQGPGGAGGAGGGFLDLTSGGTITILGTIDAAGGGGGSNPGGNFNPNYSWNPGTGGGGGGAGGGIRLLTPNAIVVQSSAIITAAGGSGGPGGASQGTNPPSNNGGAGGSGRIAMEDGDSIISGLASASVTPSEGSVGFYRGVFDATRFKGGGLTPVATSEIFPVGPFNPTFLDPVQADFKAFAPLLAVTSAGNVVMMIEARGYQMLPDGTADLTGVITPPTAWHTVGYLKDSGVEGTPTWVLAQPPLAQIDGALPVGNTGVFGITNLNGNEFIQLRIKMFLKNTISATDAGHSLDLWTIHFTADQ